MGDVNKQLDRDTEKLKGARKGGGGWVKWGEQNTPQNKQNQSEYPTEQAKSVRIPHRTSKISQNTLTEQAKSVRIPHRTSKISQNTLTEQAKSVRIPWQNKQNQSEYPDRTSKISQNTLTEQAKSVRIPWQNKQNQSEYPTEQAKSVRIPHRTSKISQNTPQNKQNQSKIWTESSLWVFSLSLSLCCEREVKRSRDETAVASKKADT